jgi:hypothetical protein
MPIEIRLLKESEYNAVNDFYNKTSHLNCSVPNPSRSYAQFCWEFIRCPYGRAIYAGVWEIDAGKEPVLVGTQSVLLLKMITGEGRQILSAKGEATLIDIKALIRYKETDILKELFAVLLQECGNRGIEFIWGFNNIPSTYKRLGFGHPFKSYYGVLVLKPLKACRNIVSLKATEARSDRLKIAVRTGLSYVYSLKKMFILSRRNRYSFNCELSENGDLFQRASFPDKMAFLLQDKKYLNWKISENPYNISYKSFQLLDENNSLAAQVICSIKKDVAFIEQTLFDGKIMKKERQAFVKRILQLMEKENICLVRYAGFNSNRLNRAEMNLLKSLGFVFTGKGEWFTFKSLSAESNVRPENIYLSRIYKQGVN